MLPPPPRAKGLRKIEKGEEEEDEEEDEEEEEGEEIRKRRRPVVLYRRYREGELPDIQIPLKDVLRPLQGLCLRDAALARQVGGWVGGWLNALC